MMSRQGLSNKTKSYKPMIKNYWTDPQLSPKEQREMVKLAATIMKKSVETKPNPNGVIRIDIDNMDKL